MISSLFSCQEKPLRYTALLISLLVIFVVYPFIPNFIPRDMILDLFISIVAMAALYSVCNKTNRFLVGLTLVLPSVIFSIMHYINDLRVFMILGCITKVLFLAYIIVLSIAYLIETNKIDKETIFGAISIYLLLALFWAHNFNLIELFIPGSFQGIESFGEHNLLSSLLYFSLTTLSTLGYGDISPTSLPAQILSTLEAIMGQIFLATLIARLIGLHIVSSKKHGTQA